MDDKLMNYIDLCRKGDPEAFRYIVAEYQQMVYVLAFRLLRDENDAKDATQDTFIKIWQNIYRYNAQYKLSTWIYKVASNICYDKMRISRKNLSLTDIELHSATSEEDSFHHRELIGLIIKAMGGLTPKQKLVFTLSEMEELDVEEIVAITGLSAAKIKSNLYLARKYIKSKIQHYE